MTIRRRAYITVMIAGYVGLGKGLERTFSTARCVFSPDHHRAHGYDNDAWQKCGVCMSIALENSHRCIERSTECDCPICGEFMFTSTLTVVFMVCPSHHLALDSIANSCRPVATQSTTNATTNT